jgi:GH18 family chitinase
MKTQNTPFPTISPTLSPTLSPTPEPLKFRVVGYATDAAVPVVIPYDKLTHINYAFLIPNDDGTFVPLLNAWMVGDLITRSHEQNVKVLVSVGGWGWDAQFEKMAADPALRTKFVQNLLKVIDQYHFDGADIDWEYPDPGDSSLNFLALMRELRAALPKDKLLTAAVVAQGEYGMGIPNEAFALMDFVNIMAYDNSGAQHSSLDFAKSSLDYWLGRGLPPEKATLGVPFYARGTTAWQSELSYARIVKADPAAAQLDSTISNGIEVNYNGIPTIQAKTRLAMERASGIMFWTLENDAAGDVSLLNAIHQVVMDGSK